MTAAIDSTGNHSWPFSHHSPGLWRRTSRNEIEANAAALASTSWRCIAEELGGTTAAFAAPFVCRFDER